MNWTPGSNRTLVMIGDAVPHEPEEAVAQMRQYKISNPHSIDWRVEADNLWKMGVKVYAVQCSTNTNASFFYKVRFS